MKSILPNQLIIQLHVHLGILQILNECSTLASHSFQRLGVHNYLVTNRHKTNSLQFNTLPRTCNRSKTTTFLTTKII